MDELISKFEKLKTRDLINPTQEYERLLSNYSKLLQFKEYPEPFLPFMKKIDSINQYYIDNIECINKYDLASLRELVVIIKELLANSINCKNPYDKLDYIITAYSNIQFIVKNMDME